jgi:hypothetical protein
MKIRSTGSTTLKGFWVYAAALILTCTFLVLSQGRASAQATPPQTTRVLIAPLSGAAIGGVVPTGKADFSSFQGGTSLVIGASNINLPDGTMLNVALDGVTVGSMVVFSGTARQLPFTAPQIHAGEVITITEGASGGGVIVLAPGSIILRGTFQAP